MGFVKGKKNNAQMGGGGARINVRAKSSKNWKEKVRWAKVGEWEKIRPNELKRRVRNLIKIPLLYVSQIRDRWGGDAVETSIG